MRPGSDAGALSAAMVLLLALGLTLAQATAPQPSTNQSPSQLTPAPDPASSQFTAEAGLLLVTIKPAAIADYELVIRTLQEALAKDTDPTRTAVAKGWRVFRAAENDAKGNAIFIHALMPAEPGFDYRPSLLLDELVKDLARGPPDALPGRVCGATDEAESDRVRAHVRGAGAPAAAQETRWRLRATSRTIGHPMKALVLVALIGIGSVVPAASDGGRQASTALTIDADAAIVTILIRPERAAAFDQILQKLKAALQRSKNPLRKAQAAGWQVFRTEEQGQGNVSYLMRLDPVVRDLEYDIVGILSEESPG